MPKTMEKPETQAKTQTDLTPEKPKVEVDKLLAMLEEEQNEPA